ncbi:hypothetical protein [Devosia sp. SD17-2]|nr:hypothetical protein [Devosia sp. SD17-2]WEJ31979.1 hypothetical protein NYQ88_13830 [Devosia sp. SD17-2]
MIRAKLSRYRVQHILTELAWGLAAATGLIFSAAMVLFGAGP